MPTAPDPSPSGGLVYLLRDVATGHVVYVGTGAVTRSLAEHAEHPRLAARVRRGQLTVSVMAVPDRATADAVASALTAALIAEPGGDQRIANRAAGRSPAFAPPGVPAALAHRAATPPAILMELGELTGGCLIVRVAEAALVDGRAPVDPRNVADTVVAGAVAGAWQIPDRVVAAWVSNTDTAPRVIVGASGPASGRYCPASMLIDQARLADTIGTDPKEIPVAGERTGDATADRFVGVDLDAAGLRGCRLSDEVRFGGLRSQSWMWLNAAGEVLAGGHR